MDLDHIAGIEKNVAKLPLEDLPGELAFAKAALTPDHPETVVWYSELLKRQAQED